MTTEERSKKAQEIISEIRNNQKLNKFFYDKFLETIHYGENQINMNEVNDILKEK